MDTAGGTTGQPFNPTYGGPVVPQNSGGPLFSEADPAFDRWKYRRKRRRSHWALWIVIACAISVGTLQSGRHSGRHDTQKVNNPSSAGADFDSVSNGAVVRVADVPGGPIDKAGMLGGDVITSFDGKSIQSERQLEQALGGITAGKTVDVMYIRDGETRTTKLTTISEDERNRLKDAFNHQEGGQGKIGVPNYKQVEVPGLGIKGVVIGSVDKNYPAYMAGLQKGDIVITFDGVPIRTADEFATRILRTQPKSTVPVEIVRAGEKKTIQLTVGEK
jgi:serine protease Do